MEIVIRAVVVFVFLWIVTRTVGRSTLGELSTFELVLYVTMGDLVQQGVTQQDYSVTSAFLGVGVFALMTVGLSYISWRWPASRAIIRGSPSIILRDGIPLLDSMKRERLAVDELVTAAREQGIRRLSDIDMAILEADGRISFFTRDAAQSGSTEPPPVS
jgi:uncharacterized membrane protein YcaP (DUF421 family)